MHTDELTLAEIFKSSGYRTGVFGKRHLGDNYPCRPQDQGVPRGLYSWWRRRRTNARLLEATTILIDTYEQAGKHQKQTGYCTDIWFDGAMKFIEKNKSRPFFCYLVTNAPHSPYYVDKKYSDIYKPARAFLRQDQSFGE